MPDNTTTPPSPSDPSSPGGPPTEVPTLVLVSYDRDPRRVGESFSFPDLHLEHLFGRGPGDGRALRVELAPRRPGYSGTPAPLADPDLSRDALRFIPRPFGFEVENLSRGRMRLAGVETTAGGVVFGETVQLDERLLLYATRRPVRLDLRFLPPGARGPFGEADPFGIIGESWRILVALDALAFAARMADHVLLHGESGSGKELFGGALHALSSRAAGPFVSRNAAGLPATLAESELFGNAKSYPQSGMPERAGMIGQAAGGTCFLDELGRLPPELQAQLLRVLDAGGEYWRLGDPRPRRSDFRMVAATNALLATLQHDLLARFKQVVELPPLRDRLEDVPLILRALALRKIDPDSELRKRFVEERPDGTRFVRIGIDLIDALLVSDHPMNVRGLETDLLTSIRLSRGSRLRASPGLWAGSRRHARSTIPPTVGPGGHLRELTPEEVARLRQLVDGTHGCKSRAAKTLGWSRHQVTRAMDRYDITAPEDPEEPDEGE